jgi:uncharacterized repeat protein (TIGR01451 family)
LLATGSNPSAIATGDINRDGSADLVVANSGSNTVSLLRNTCPIPDLVPVVVHNGSFAQGDTGKTYTITVTNGGVTGTTAAVSVADTLPPRYRGNCGERKRMDLHTFPAGLQSLRLSRRGRQLPLDHGDCECRRQRGLGDEHRHGLGRW